VIIFVYIFLQGWRATLIPLLAVPVSLIGTFAFFPIFGFSINTLSVVWDLVLASAGGGRRHRCGGSSGTSYRSGMAPKAEAFKAMKKSRAGDRHRAGSFRGVRADGLHSPGITGASISNLL